MARIQAAWPHTVTTPFTSKTGDSLRKRVCSGEWQEYTHEDTLH
jgi:hypothetical protein